MHAAYGLARGQSVGRGRDADAVRMRAHGCVGIVYAAYGLARGQYVGNGRDADAVRVRVHGCVGYWRPVMVRARAGDINTMLVIP